MKHLARLGLTGVPYNEIMKTFARRRQEAFRKIINGTALEVMVKFHIRRDWLWHSKTFPSQNKIMSGTLPTRINLHRGDSDQSEKKFCHCQGIAETDMHILNVCHISKDARSKRHNLIAKKNREGVKGKRLSGFA